MKRWTAYGWLLSVWGGVLVSVVLAAFHATNYIRENRRKAERALEEIEQAEAKAERAARKAEQAKSRAETNWARLLEIRYDR